MSVLVRWATKKGKKMKKKNRGMCEGTGWATRLRKRGKNRKDLRGTCEDSGQATRLRKSGKRKVEEGTV